MKVPVGYQLFGIKRTVSRRKGLTHEQGSHGEWYGNTKTIVLDADLSDAMAGETFLHEVVHDVLIALGHDEQGHDENYISPIARALHQVLESAEYAEDEP